MMLSVGISSIPILLRLEVFSLVWCFVWLSLFIQNDNSSWTGVQIVYQWAVQENCLNHLTNRFHNVNNAQLVKCIYKVRPNLMPSALHGRRWAWDISSRRCQACCPYHSGCNSVIWHVVCIAFWGLLFRNCLESLVSFWESMSVLYWYMP